jgi:TM2 domain-containing membrane protein YozV
MNQLPEHRRSEFQIAYQAQKKDRTVAILFSIFLGHFGVDRFYLGQVGLGVGKLLTFGACGVWTIIDWFLIMAAADSYNYGVLHRLATLFPLAAPPMMGPPGGPPPGGYGLPPAQGGYGG